MLLLNSTMNIRYNITTTMDVEKITFFKVVFFGLKYCFKCLKLFFLSCVLNERKQYYRLLNDNFAIIIVLNRKTSLYTLKNAIM